MVSSLENSKTQQPLTPWRVKDSHCQQVWNTARHNSHSLTGEPREGIVSRFDIQQATAATHFLENQEEALSAGLKHSKLQQLLTSW